jgi:hypothetical protein
MILIIIGVILLITHSVFLGMPAYNRPMIWNLMFFRLLVMGLGYLLVFIGVISLFFS